MGAYHMAATRPGADVTGIDLLDSNVSMASFLYGATRGLSYKQGDALALPFKDGSVDKVLCLEAAFHFPRRDRFLAEVARVLAPGGRAVVVDFAWSNPRSDGNTAKLLESEYGRLVRETWGFDDFSTVTEYRDDTAAAGLRIAAELDWTSRVTRPLQWLFGVIARLGNTNWGRSVLQATVPPLRSLSRAEWRDLKQSADAHASVHGAARYVVFVIEKPR
jgi:MPBQ/MSBQ methyltransferase